MQKMRWFYRAATSINLFLLCSGASVIAHATCPGALADRRFDFDGDGKTDLAVFRQSTGQWFVILSSTGGTDNSVWGNPGENDIPVPGDYDGDCKIDTAYWNPATGIWNIKPSSGGSPISRQWGASSLGDIPVDSIRLTGCGWRPAAMHM